MMMMALVCLQAQQVSGLPAAAEGRQIQLHLQQQHSEEEEAAAASARCMAGVAAFHDQVLLLHCTPVDSITSVAIRVSSSSSCLLVHPHGDHQVHEIDLAAQLHHPSPSVLSFVLHAGAVLTLTLHHRLIRRRRSLACLPRRLMTTDCLRTRTDHPSKEEKEEDDGDQSSGFITIEKGTISRRHPPSDNLLTIDDSEEVDHKPVALLAEEELQQVENEFLAKLDGDLLDALIKDAEAELHDLYLS